MRLRSSLCLTLALGFVACAALLPTDAAAQSRQTVTGTVVSISGRAAGRTRQFTLRVNNYTTASDAERLNNALRSGGEDELMNVLSRLDAGRVSIGTGVGVPANAVIATPASEGSTKLMVLFQRDIGFGELHAGARRRSEEHTSELQSRQYLVCRL